MVGGLTWRVAVWVCMCRDGGEVGEVRRGKYVVAYNGRI